MTVRDFIELYCDAGIVEIEVYDLDNEETIFKGYADEVTDDIECREIASLDAPIKDIQVINV